MRGNKKIGTIVVIGSCIIDMTIFTHRFPLVGESLVASRSITQVGGKASNQSIGISRLGGMAWLISKIGLDEWGGKALRLWQDERVNTQYISRHATEATGMGIVVVTDEGNNWTLSSLNANRYLMTSDIDVAVPIIRSAQVVSIHLNLPLETLHHALSLAKQMGVTTILNASPAEHLDNKILALVDILVVNQLEAAQLTGIGITNEPNSNMAIQELIQRGAKTVVISLGGQGLLVATNAQTKRYPSLPVVAIDTVGAGDALIAGLAVALGEGKDIWDACRFATAASALSVTRHGTWESMPYREEVEDYLRKSVKQPDVS